MAKAELTPEEQREKEDRIFLVRAAEKNSGIGRIQVREVLDRMQRPPRCDLATIAEDALIARWAGADVVRTETLRRELDTIRREAAGPNPSALEVLLADRVAMAWFHVKHAEAIYAGISSKCNTRETLLFQSRIDQVERRYLNAIRTLAQVRRLKSPALQVNIAAAGGQQVNVAGSVNGTAQPSALAA